jgi:hypothetical protein
MKSKATKWIRKGKALGIALSVYSMTYVIAYAQDGNAGINEAATQVRSYFDTGTQLMYAIGAVVGLIGAVKVYQKWNAGEPDTGKVAAAWFGSCIFLVIVATVLRSFEIFTLSDQEYEAFHHALVKAIKVLPVNSVFHKQDWFLSRGFDGAFDDKILSFLSHSSERFFNERPYLDHTCYIMLTRKLNGRRDATSMFSTLTKRNIVPDETINDQKLQEFLDSWTV